MARDQQKTGLLLINLGTPEATDFWSIRRYLSEFLSDQRVVELPALLWQPILQGIVLTVRPKKSGAAYDQIWNREKNESPLKTITRSQSEKLAKALEDQHPDLIVDWAMRYGQPALADKIDSLIERGCQKILLFPLYPQYSGATTATVNDQAYRKMMALRNQPSIRTVPAYYEDPAYISALKKALLSDLEQLDWQPDRILASMHGMPKVTADKGDPYFVQCQQTIACLQKELGWDDQKMQLVFQSRFGAQEWLKPYAEPAVEELARNGVKNLAIFCPGFASDCVETLEEVALGLKETFLEAGGEKFAYLPCLNDRDVHIEMLQSLAEKEMMGWLS
ncbi:ferrochelatase [Rhodovibrionaceae bacterium A322]